MTDNEKASTYIGWERGQGCLEMQATASGGPVGYYCVNHRTTVPHDVPAPDMSLPANYMAALEKIEALEVIFQIYDGLNVSIHKDKYREKLGEKGTAYGFDEESWGLAVVMALAALYDAEHPEEKE